MYDIIYKIFKRRIKMSTIAAISTAPGIGGIGIIRMSGENCFEVLEKIFKHNNLFLLSSKSYQIRTKKFYYLFCRCRAR